MALFPSCPKFGLKEKHPLSLLNPLKPEEREKRKSGWLGETLHLKGEVRAKFSVMKVPRQCQLVLIRM
jgi:hypothetical protein